MRRNPGSTAWSIAFAIAIAVGALWLFYPNRSEPLPPEVTDADVSGMEPQVEARIRLVLDALRGEGDSASAWGRAGQVYHAHELHAAAVACYDRAGELNPRDYRWPYLAALALQGDRIAESLTRFERAADLDPPSPSVFLHFGNALTRTGQLDRARQQYERAWRLDERSSAALYGLGQLALMEGDEGTALDRLEQARGLEPEHGEVHALLAGLYQRRGDTERAEQEALLAKAYPGPRLPPDPVVEAMEAEAVSSKALAERGIALGARGDYAAAESAFRRVLEIRPPEAQDFTNLAIVLAQQGHLDEAQAEFRKGLREYPEDFELLTNFGAFLASRNELEQAGAHLVGAVRINSNSSDAHYNLGLVRERQNRVAEAIDHYETALRLDPALTGVRSRLGHALAAVGRTDEAIAYWRQALAVRPRDVSTLYGLSNAYVQRGQHEAAVRLLNQGLQIEPNQLRLVALLAWELATAPEKRVRDGVRAVELARRVLEAMPDEARAADLMAAALAEAGRFDEAAALARAALDAAKRAGAADLAAAIESRITLYRSERPYRQGAVADGVERAR